MKIKRDTTKKELQSESLKQFVKNFEKKPTTYREVKQRLVTFEEFVKEKYNTLVDTRFINNRLVVKRSEVKGNKIYVYDLFSNYVEYLNNKDLSRERIQYLLVYARRAINFFLDEDISKDKFRDFVNPNLPVSDREDKTLIGNDDIKRLIYACGNELKLRTLITVLSSTGARIGELLKIKHKYLTLEWTKEKDAEGKNIDIPPHIDIPAFITKTRRQRKAYLTTEAVQCLKDWLEYKYRDRKIVKQVNGKYASLDYVKPSEISESYIFRMNEPTSEKEIKELEDNMNIRYRHMYQYIQPVFKELVEKEGLGKKFRNKKNNSVSIHSLRWYAVNTVEDLSNITSAYFWVGKRQKGYIFPERDNKKYWNCTRKLNYR